MAIKKTLFFISTNPTDPRSERDRQATNGRIHAAKLGHARRRERKNIRTQREYLFYKNSSTCSESTVTKVEARPCQPLPLLLDPRPDWSWEEKRGLHHFLTLTAFLTPHSDGVFFNLVCPCLAIHDLGIRNILLSIVATKPDPSGILSTSSDKHEGVSRCNVAIQHFRSNISLLPHEVVQASCILLACVELLYLQIRSAKRYIDTARAFTNIPQKSFERLRSSTVRRTATDSTDASQNSSFIRQAITTAVVKSTAATRFWDLEQAAPLKSTDILNLSFEPLAGRKIDSYELLAATERLAFLCHQVAQNLTYQSHLDPESPLAQGLEKEINNLNDFLQISKAEISPTSLAALRIECNTYCAAVSRIIFRCQILGARQTDYDHYTTDFRAVLRTMAKVLFRHPNYAPKTFVFIPFTMISLRFLWFIVNYCRDPTVRRHALSLIKTPRRHEGGLDSWIVYNAAKAVLELEEGNAMVLTASDIPENERIVVRGFEFDGKDAFIMLYSYPSGSKSSPTVPYTSPLHLEPDQAETFPTLDPQAILDSLNSLHKGSAQIDISEAPNGYGASMTYEHNPVKVCCLRDK